MDLRVETQPPPGPRQSWGDGGPRSARVDLGRGRGINPIDRASSVTEGTRSRLGSVLIVERMPPGLGRFGCVPNHILLDMPLQLCRRESRRLSRKRASWLAGWLAACMPASIVRCPVRLTPVLEAKHSTETQNPAEAPYDGYYTLQSPSRSLSLARRDSRATMSRTPVQNRGNSRARNRGRPNFN